MRRKMSLIITLTAALLVVVAAPALACETGMWITSDPGSGDPGTVVTVRGGGWEPGSVTLRWDASAESGGAVLSEVPVGADGTIETQVTIPDGAPGQHKIVAEHTQAAGEVTHGGDWNYFTIPGAAPAQEQPSAEEQQPQQAERRDSPPARTDAPEVTDAVSDRTAPVQVQSEAVAEPSVVTPRNSVAVVEQRPAVRVRSDQLPLGNGRGIDLARALREPAMVDAPLLERVPAAPVRERENNPLPWWLAAAVGALLLPLLARRRRHSPPSDADVLDLPLPNSTQEERKAA